MANTGILQKAMGYSAHVEMIIRRLYRNRMINSIIPKDKVRKNPTVEHSFDFNNVVEYIKKLGVKPGDILIVHAAYKPMKPSGLSPEEIIEALLSIIGPEGTLVMPVIRRYPEYPAENDAIKADISDIVFEYNVQKTKIWTGIVAKTLMERKDAVTSRFPLNTITAVGPHAKLMIANELIDELPAPNGKNSAWNYCLGRNAWVISIGTDLTHSLTMIHTAEDVKKDKWPVKDWYREVKFRIIEKDFQLTKTVRERHPRWGMLHFAERKLSRDLINDFIITSKSINGVLVESLQSKQLIDYLNNKNQSGYPYFWLNKHLKK